MSTSNTTDTPVAAIRMSREVLVYDLLLVALNVGFVVTIYVFGGNFTKLANGAGVPIEDAMKIAMLGIFWALGNLGLVIGLLAAMRRAAGQPE